MAAFELTINLKAQVLKLQDLTGYLEDRHELGAGEYVYCQAALHDVLEQLKRLERLTGIVRWGIPSLANSPKPGE